MTANSLQFSFFNNFSGQIVYESWTLSLYNVIFTVLPPLVIGVFDQFVSARMLDRYPQLYMLGQKNTFFTKTAFWLWISNALYHSLVSVTFDISLRKSPTRSSGPLRPFDYPLLGRPEAVQRSRLRPLVLGNITLSCCAFNGPRKGRFNI